MSQKVANLATGQIPKQQKKWLVAAARLLNRKEVASGRQLLKQKKSG